MCMCMCMCMCIVHLWMWYGCECGNVDEVRMYTLKWIWFYILDILLLFWLNIYTHRERERERALIWFGNFLLQITGKRPATFKVRSSINQTESGKTFNLFPVRLITFQTSCSCLFTIRFELLLILSCVDAVIKGSRREIFIGIGTFSIASLLLKSQDAYAASKYQNTALSLCGHWLRVGEKACVSFC